jgi:hypothetical protein
MKKHECFRKHVIFACRTLCIFLLSAGTALSQVIPPANGAYHPAIFVTDNKENTYAYSVTDTASSKEEIDGILKKRWNDMKDIDMIYLEDDVAKCRTLRTHVINGNATQVTYYIYFGRDINGTWRIDKF